MCIVEDADQKIGQVEDQVYSHRGNFYIRSILVLDILNFYWCVCLLVGSFIFVCVL